MPKPPKYRVFLTPQDRSRLERTVKTGSHPAQMILRARILLELDQRAGPVAFRAAIAGRVGASEIHVGRVARQFVESGGDVDSVIERKKRETPPVEPKLTGDVEARLIALACSSPPTGHARWSLRLLEKHVLLTDGMPALDHSTIGRALRKHNFVLI
jgi:Homeodomain-like domain